MSLSTSDGSGQGVASPHGSHTVCWQPVLGGSRPAQQTNHPYDTNPANQQNVTLSDIGRHQCPCRPQMGQAKVWPAHTGPTQCVGSLYSVGIGLHRISTRSTREIQPNQLFVMQSRNTELLCPCGPRCVRKGCGQPTSIPHSVLAACTLWE